MNIRSFIIIALGAIIAVGCIKNDIPYPQIQANFLTFSVVGQDRGSLIDSANLTVTVYLPEEINIEEVAIENYSITPGSHVVGNVLDGQLNLSKPKYVELEYYQSYLWTIKAQQTISRYFTVSSQVGASVIDVPARRVVAQVAKKADLSSIKVESIKLGPEGSEMTPDLEGQTVDFSKPVEVTVSAYNGAKFDVWTLYVVNSDTDVETVSADAWSNVAWVYGRGEAGRNNGVEYRLQGDDQWTKVNSTDIVYNGGDFAACIKHLSPLTTYQTRVYSDDVYGEVITFTTGSVVQVPNHNLDQWWLDGKVWCPWSEGGEQYWDTGNKGATTIGASNSVPTEDTSSGTGWAAMLETKFVGFGPIGKLAAGNLFVGRYVRTDGTNGVLSFGRPFTERPTKLRGYLKYNCATINYANTEMQSLIGQPDTCIVWMSLIDSSEPFEIRTNPKDRQLFDPDGDYVVAYGKVEYGQTVANYIPFEFELNYKSTSRVPKYIIITASASKYGDYFTGGSGSVLYLDDLELLYDY